MRRILTLTHYLLIRQFRSTMGIIGLLSTIVLWWVFFYPTDNQATGVDPLILIIGIYGFILSFIMTLSMADKTYHSSHLPLFTRLRSRVEFLTAILASVVLFSLLLQLFVVAILFIQPNNFILTSTKIMIVPPLWISVNIFAVALALHATDLVQSGWSRAWIYGIVTILLFSQSADIRTIRWLSTTLKGWATSANNREWTQLNAILQQASDWVFESGLDFTEALGIVFWPFQAMTDGILSGELTNAQAIAPTILLLYATILFLLAADFFTHKDLYLFD